MRANPLAQKIVASDIELGLNSNFAFYAPDNCACLLLACFFGPALTKARIMRRGVPVEQHGDAEHAQLHYAGDDPHD